MNHLDFNGLKIAWDFWDGWKIFMMGDYLWSKKKNVYIYYLWSKKKIYIYILYVYQAFKDPISLKADRSQVSSHPSVVRLPMVASSTHNRLSLIKPLLLLPRELPKMLGHGEDCCG